MTMPALLLALKASGACQVYQLQKTNNKNDILPI
jgi:hypothetical protein